MNNYLTIPNLKKALASLTLSSSTLIIIRTIWRLISEMKYPGTLRFPLIGSLPSIIFNHAKLRDYNYNLLRYNKYVMFRIPGVGRVWRLVDPIDVQHILKNNFHNYDLGRQRKDVMLDFLGSGIFNSDGSAWSTQRKTASYQFSNNKFKNFYLDVFLRHGNRVLDILEKHAKSGRPLDFQELISRYTMDSICEIAFGVSMGCLECEGEVPFSASFNFATARCVNRFFDPLWKVKRYLNIGDERKMKRCMIIVNKICYDIIAKARQLSEEELSQQDNLLYRFMLSKDENGNPYSDKYLRDIVLNFILAGRDTTANALCWAIYMLHEHPEVGKRSKEEIESILKGKQLPTFEDLKHANYTKALLSETLRLYPSVPEDGVVAVGDDVLPSGIKIKAGEPVDFMPYAMGRREDIWGPLASKFEPDRWLDSNGQWINESHFKFTAFKAGPRICLGMDMAYLEMMAFLSLLVRKYTLKIDPSHKVHYDISLTLPMKNGLPVTVHPLTVSLP